MLLLLPVLVLGKRIDQLDAGGAFCDTFGSMSRRKEEEGEKKKVLLGIVVNFFNFCVRTMKCRMVVVWN